MTSFLSALNNSLQRPLLIFVACLFTSAEAANFNYNQVQVQVGYATLDEPVVIATSDETADNYQYLSVLGFSASYQYPNNVFIGASTTQGESKTEQSKIESKSHSAYVGYALGFRRTYDLYATIGGYRSEAKACNESTCFGLSDESFGYDVGVRGGAKHWFEWGVNVKAFPFKKGGESATLGAQGAIWIHRQSSLTVNVIRSKDTSALAFGYRFSY